MPQRLNWTNRKRIEKADVQIVVAGLDRDPEFTAAINLSAYELPPDCRVVVEAYRQTMWRRFDFGTVAFIRAQEACSLAAFGDAEGVQFRVKVLSGIRDDGRIWAEADQLPFVSQEKQDASRRSLLPTRGADLEESVWELEFDETSSGPMLVVNNRLGDWRQTVKTVAFRSLVYPEVFRQVLRKALNDEDDELTGWQGDWVRFATQLPGVGDRPEQGSAADDVQQWIDGAVRAFSRQQKFCERLATSLSEGDNA
jgi:hypothetical protein